MKNTALRQKARINIEGAVAFHLSKLEDKYGIEEDLRDIITSEVLVRLERQGITFKTIARGDR